MAKTVAVKLLEFPSQIKRDNIAQSGPQISESAFLISKFISMNKTYKRLDQIYKDLSELKTLLKTSVFQVIFKIINC